MTGEKRGERWERREKGRDAAERMHVIFVVGKLQNNIWENQSRETASSLHALVTLVGVTIPKELNSGNWCSCNSVLSGGDRI